MIDYEPSLEIVVDDPCDPVMEEVREDCEVNEVDDEAIMMSIHEHTMGIINENL